MDVATAIGRLESAGTEPYRAIYRRHGARDPMYGVLISTLDKIAREAKRDQALADALWATGNYDARLLACKVADPATTTEAKLDAWLGEMDVYVLVDIFVTSVASQVPGVRARADRWAAETRDWTSQAGWDLYAWLAINDQELDDGSFLDLLTRIERGIGRAGNRTRHSMNGALIAIGVRNAGLRAAAEAAAGRIGNVVVDHGKTGCVTPAAVPYIAKTWDRRRSRAVAPSGTAVGAP